MLSAVLLHMIESSVPVDFETSLDSLFHGCAGVVDVAGADSLHILDLDRFVDGAIIAWLSTSLREENYSRKQKERGEKETGRSWGFS